MKSLKVKDTILIQAGDKVPADGLLFEGKIKVSQAALNGESRDENKAAVTNMDEAESTDYSSHGKSLYGFCCDFRRRLHDRNCYRRQF